ncbi:ABC transporter permease [Sulfobacillus thermosulfidooxidans]|uniref:Peptide/nickel transport system permease protein n=2 Tax=Sulfobacillus thermosulfidooxidans TaxID=28034 RepID=A0A1W1WJJ7_SULTA|nr:ABC transporter permease [Sulfobacillus thermosulfidooxidans]OLZ12223.1 ABC transporter [Sulfobacillus thermosulfidooxidans]OLZ12996.1 ABC transporter [Sulfobacillus thermosulfidooxidans]OLZ21797.1 ABC transporter [Sulfobacillus thermosulfidooxidans]PSR27626.1 MAG: ABC transporter permease [Sulfobacillus thermosulfidooxidans]SMC06488.1 peptide/nickel transport system permease protein [Sulfobacillus thermosulfidooxidans DSM 9293]
MLVYIIRRLIQSIPALIGIAIFSFILLHIVPGGPAQTLLGPHQTPQRIAAINRALGLNKPLYVQFWIWFVNLLHGNFGYSYSFNQPVLTVIGQYLPHTIAIVVVAIMISHLIAIILGTIQGYFRNRWFDHVITTITFFFWSMPVFWLAIMVVLVFSIYLGWFPSGGINFTNGGPAGFVGYVDHATLPILVLVLATVASWARFMRSSMIDSMLQDYIRTARSKGLSELAVVFKHALRNSLLPIITLFGLSIPSLFGGALVVELVFNYPGMGLLFWNAANERDYPILLGIIMIIGLLTVVGNLLADILYSLVDPRISYK